MKNLTKKIAILKSLEEMDDQSADKVINFINTMFWDSFKNPRRQKIKEKAMRQIQRALQKNGSRAPFTA